MLDLIRANKKVHFIFFRRNGILMAVSAIFILYALISFIPFAISSHSDFFAILMRLFDTLVFIAGGFAVLLAVLLVNDSLKNRNLKMVITKPCPSDIWLLSCFWAVLEAALYFFIIITVFAALYSIITQIPFQSGFIFMAIYHYLGLVISVSIIFFLAVAFPPIIALLIYLLFNSSTIYWLYILVKSNMAVSGENIAGKIITWVLYGIYMALPTTTPFMYNLERISTTMKVNAESWIYLIYFFFYALIVLSFFFVLSNFFLKRKNII